MIDVGKHRADEWDKLLSKTTLKHEIISDKANKQFLVLKK